MGGGPMKFFILLLLVTVATVTQAQAQETIKINVSGAQGFSVGILPIEATSTYQTQVLSSSPEQWLGKAVSLWKEGKLNSVRVRGTLSVYVDDKLVFSKSAAFKAFDVYTFSPAERERIVKTNARVKVCFKCDGFSPVNKMQDKSAQEVCTFENTATKLMGDPAMKSYGLLVGVPSAHSVFPAVSYGEAVRDMVVLRQ